MEETLLVTGATGAIGRVVVPMLTGAGFKVRGHHARHPGANLPGVEWRRADFSSDTPAMDALVDGCAGIVHLAAELADPARMERVNVAATAALVAAALRGGVRYFGFASSMVVYGSPARRDIDEDSATIDLAKPLQAQFHEPFATQQYARTKLMGEHLAARAADHMAVDILRIAKSADPQRMLEARTWSPAQKAMRLYGRTHYIDQRDCAAAIVHLARLGLRRGPGRETYIIADDGGGTYADLLGAVDKRLGTPGANGRRHVPLALEMIKNALKYRSVSLRWPAGFARLHADKLRATGFTPPIGYAAALDEAIMLDR